MKTSEKLQISQIYTRKQLQEMFDIVDATINTGVFRPKGHDSVWLFVTEHKTPDRTQYTDHLDGDILHWDGQMSGRTDRIIIDHGQQELELLLFYRKRKYEHPGAGFRYEGPFVYASHEGSRPTRFTLRRALAVEEITQSDLDALQTEEEYFEGSRKSRFTNYYERNPKLRTAAILYHGMKCKACGFDFGEVYGERGAGYIEVHHLHPVSNLGRKVKIDPKTDMTVVCSNCHRMIHRKKDEVLSLAELKRLIQR